MMKRKNILLIVVLALAVVAGGVFWFRQGEKTDKLISENPKGEQKKADGQKDVLAPSAEYSVRPDFSRVKDFKNTLQLQKGVSVKYGNGWEGRETGDKEFVSGQLVKTLDGRSYLINLQENGVEFFSPELQRNTLLSSSYQKIKINGKSHFVLIASDVSSEGNRNDFTYLVSPCPAMQEKACSLPLNGSFLYVSLEQYVPDAQEAKPLNFSRPDDQQILAEFTEIMSTLKY